MNNATNNQNHLNNLMAQAQARFAHRTVRLARQARTTARPMAALDREDSMDLGRRTAAVRMALLGR